MYVITFEDFTPSARHDGFPWTHARVEEAEARIGPFTPIDTILLDPVDANPATPAERDITTEKATLPSGWYQLVFFDEQGNQQPTEAIFHNAVRTNYTPGLGDVGALIHSRTVDGNSNELGTFTAATTPTADQVARLINKATGHVTDRIGSSIPPSLWTSAAEVIAIRAAMLVELSYFANQISADRSPYGELKKLYDEGLAALVAAWKALGPDGEPGTADDVGQGGLPATSAGAGGWDEVIW